MGVVASELLRSGNATRAAVHSGFLPLPLDHVRVSALAEIPVYLRAGGETSARFTLYCSEHAQFTDAHRQRLHDAGVEFIYIPASHLAKFREQVENGLIAMAADPSVPSGIKAELVYEASVELLHDLLTGAGVGASSARMERVACGVATLIAHDAAAFPHLFATAQHDFYLPTHMVNVGLWMTAIAFASGMQDVTALAEICTAGMLHDIGKLGVPAPVLNRTGVLTEEDWLKLRAHAIDGADHLYKEGVRDELVLCVAREHHERLNGKGYPKGLKGNAIHLASRMCAIADSFDAMTALRPFKKRARTIAEALAVLQTESPERYDAGLVQVWATLLRQAARDGLLSEPVDPPGAGHHGRRAHERFTIDCQARAHALRKGNGDWEEEEAIAVRAHSISRGGLGFLTQRPREVSAYVRVYMLGTGTMQSRVLEGQVVRCRTYQDGWYEVGVKFCKPGKDEVAAAGIG